MYFLFSLICIIHIIICNSYDRIELRDQNINIQINNRYATVTYSFKFINVAQSPQELIYEMSIDHQKQYQILLQNNY